MNLMSADRFDAIVIGGGPGGAACARHLAAGGARVALFEEPRRHEKVCGGCLTAPAWDEVGRDPALRPTPVERASFEWLSLAPAARDPIRAVLPIGTEIVLVDRTRLDAHLLARAETAGAKVFRERVRRFCRAASGWSVETDVRRADAAILVGADGCRSMVRSSLVGEWRPSHLAWGVAVRPEWADLGPAVCRPGEIRAIFLGVPPAIAGPGDRRHGYAYAFGPAGRPELGVWRRGSGRAALDLLRGLLGRGWLSESAQQTCRVLGRPSPCIAVEAEFDRPTAGAGWLLVGDAAGHVNPLTGEGIRYALRGGRHAAEAILDGHLASYPERWQADYGEVLRWGARLVQFNERTEVTRRLILSARKRPSSAALIADLAFARGSYREIYLKGSLTYALRLIQP